MNYSWPVYSEEEIAAVTDVMRGGKVNYWTGSICREFEKEYAQFFGTDYAIALTNGTVALELALYALNIGVGDEVIVTPRTFIASASAIYVRGATPVFADVCPNSGNITAEEIEKVITSRTKAIIPVHLGGWPCDMNKIMALAREKNIYVIEDCAQCHGAKIDGQYAGTFGDISAWSFCQDKIITTGGEGGMVTTNNAEWWDKMWSYKDHGKSWDARYNRQHDPGFVWLHESFGTNWRLTEMQGAIGRIQLQRLTSWIERRRTNAGILYDFLMDSPLLRIPLPPENIYHAYYRFYAYLHLDALKYSWNRERIIAEISEQGVFAGCGSCGEIYREKAFIDTNLAPVKRLPNAMAIGETSLAFLVHNTIDDAEMARQSGIIAKVIANATR
jgi:dTDP-4-amino-4,6-dideoxygalactose transaminase